MAATCCLTHWHGVLNSTAVRTVAAYESVELRAGVGPPDTSGSLAADKSRDIGVQTKECLCEFRADLRSSFELRRFMSKKQTFHWFSIE